MTSILDMHSILVVFGFLTILVAPALIASSQTDEDMENQ
jgi:hypothetical protein